jgi:hypothetical protein
MICDFCGGKCGVHQCPDTLDYVCTNCIEDARAAAWDEINSEFDKLAVPVAVEVEETTDGNPPW